MVHGAFHHGPRLKNLTLRARAGLFTNIDAKLSPLPKTLTLKRAMGSQQQDATVDPPKRPFCHRCSKPLRLCLCSRLKTPPLDNPIGITILQHSLEKHHPLNSTRVARLGLKNLAVVLVTDVNFTADFTIRPIDANRVHSGKQSNYLEARCDLDQEIFNFERARDRRTVAADGNCNVKKGFEESSDLSPTHLAVFDDLDGRNDNRAVNGQCADGICLDPLKKAKSIKFQPESLNFDHIKDGVEATFDKYRVTCSATDLRVTIARTAKPDIGWILDTPVGRAFTFNGFTVRKLQRRQLPGSEELQEFEEFNMVVPPRAALLFPSGKSAISLDEVDFEVKHLVVLDGTWAKAQRMYHENPWLKLLPHLKLDPGRESLYSDVRHQPKVGCLSTIESIICALKGLGNDMEGLDELLGVFESMIGDQRRCKDEKFGARTML